MANATAYVPTNMYAAATWQGTVTLATGSYVRLESYPHRQDFFGSFTYDQTGLTGGTITSLHGYEADIFSWSVIDIALPAQTYLAYITASNIQEVYTYIFSTTDTFTGSSGNDALESFGGNDTIDAGLGNDVIDGGTGTDTAIFVGNRSQYLIVPEVQGWLSVIGTAGVDVLRNVENLQFADQSVNPASFTLPASPGGIRVTAESALDMGDYSTWLGTISFADSTLIRLTDDTHTQDNFGTFTLDQNGNASGTIQSMVTALAGTPKLWITNLNLDLATYSSYVNANNLQGLYTLAMAGNDHVSGSSGNDQLLGFAGNDTLDGGTGNDNMTGGAGNDTYVVDNIGDVITENPGEGTDTIQTSLAYALPANVENIMFSGSGDLNFTGNALANVITGNSGNNLFDGGAGNDTMLGGDGTDTLNGGLGNDSLMGGDGDDTVIVATSDGDDILSGGNGFDTLDFSAVGGLINIDQLGGHAYGSAGNDTILDVFGYVIGTNFNDVLSGGNVGDVLDGNGGDDMFFGNKGDDLLRGGDGDDTFFFAVSDGDDRLLGGNGFDVLDYSGLGGVVQVNQFAGTTNGTAGNDILLDLFEMVIGTSFDDALSGGNGPNTLKGGGGNDQIFANGGDDYLNGGPGNDTLVMGPGNDTLDFWAGDQLETITDFQAGAGSEDTITLTHYSGIPRTLAGLQGDNRITQVGADTHIALNGGDEIILQNVTAVALHQDDFVF